MQIKVESDRKDVINGDSFTRNFSFRFERVFSTWRNSHLHVITSGSTARFIK